MNKLLITFILFSLNSCAQQKEKKQENSLKIINQIAMEDLNSENIVDYISSQVKVYDKNPMYIIRPLQNSCIYEIYVNGILVDKNYSLRKLASPIEVNSGIMKSGIQKVTYRLFPLGDLMVEEFGKGDTINTLLKKTSMQIQVLRYNDVKKSTGLDDEIEVVSHESPTKKNGEDFIGAGLPYYEQSFTFEAQVPYEIESWMEGEDLTDYDSKELEKILLAKSNRIKHLYEEQDLDALAREVYVAYTKFHIANYRNLKEISEYWEAYCETVKIKDKKFQPIKDYELQFYDDGRIVKLQHSTLNPPDSRLKGKAALFFLESDGYRISANFLPVPFYLPKGKSLNELERL